MPVLFALAYSLLYVRIRLQLEACFVHGQGCVLLSAGALGLYLHRDYDISLEEQLHVFLMKTRGRTAKRKKRIGSVFLFRLVRSCLLDNRYAGQREKLAVNVRFGLGSAAETAVGAGAVHALLCALFAGIGAAHACELRVIPSFDKVSFQADVTGIFSLRIGDIMLAALKAALRKRARD